MQGEGVMSIRVVVVFVGLAAVFSAGWLINGWRMASREQALWQRARAETEVRLKRQEEAADEAKRQREQALADARAARDVAGRLRRRIDAFARGGCAAAAGAGKAAGNAGVVCAELFRRIDERAGALAELADESRVAGLACEAAYAAVRGR